MSNFIVQFPMKTQKYQEDVLDKRFEIGRKIYNTLVTITQKRYKNMINSKEYKELKLQLTDDKTKNKVIFKQINELRKQYNFTEYSFYNDMKYIQKHFKANIDANTGRTIAAHLWKAYEKLFYGDGKAIHYKKYGTLNTLEGKTNSSGIRFKNNTLMWNGLSIPVKIDYNNTYEYQAMQCDIRYCRIVRKYIKNKYKYYLQLIFKGNKPIKLDKVTGEVKHRIGNGDVGLDIGTQTIAISSKTDIKLIELADKVQNIENQKRLLLRKMDRSRRATNSNNYNEDGTIKKQGNKKMIWVKSNHYIKLQNNLKELYRKQADIRKYQHECLSNYIISLGDHIYVENMNFKALQKRSTKTEKNENGKYKRKKRFGKSLANKAPSMLLTMINRKLGYFGKQLIEINTKECRASQFNHFEQTYKKKKLSQRWNKFGDIKVQRDLYSAFLIMNVNSDLSSFNQVKCNERFKDFYIKHNIEINRLSNYKNLSSIGI